MDVRALAACCETIEGARVERVEDDAIRLRRTEDGLGVDVRVLPASIFPGYRREADRIVTARWTLPRATSLEELARWNAGATLAVATAHRHENLYGKSDRTFVRGRLLATGLAPERLVAALAHDLGLHARCAPPEPPPIADVHRALDAHPVVTAEEALLDALMGGNVDHGGEHYQLVDGALEGPSSVGMSKGKARPIPIRVEVGAFGFVRIRHVARVPGGKEPLALCDALTSESSSDESLVRYHRAFPLDAEHIALDLTATVESLGSQLFQLDIRALEIAASAYLGVAS